MAGPSPTLDIGQASAAGPRARNEDFHGCVVPEGAWQRLGALVCVADGIGGCADGRHAAETTVRTLLNDYYATPMAWRGVKGLYVVADSVNGWLFNQGRSHDRGLGTTLVAALFRGRTLSVLSVGDSRLYRLREHALTRLTRDHVFGGADLSVLTKAVGLDDRFTPDTGEEPLCVGDRYLLLTDGAWRELAEADLAHLAADGAPQAVAGRLVQAALRTGTDNATAVVVDVLELPPAEAADVVREWTDMPVVPPPKPGQSLDGFRILRRLHRSLQGELLAALDETTGQAVVLKFPDVLAASDPAWLERFAREEWAGLRLRHPNVVRVLAQPPGRRHAGYFVLEYLEGLSLRALADQAGQAGLMPERVAGWLRQAATGLNALHRRGIVHRDVKPDNLFLTTGGTVVVLDLGTARIDGLAPLSTEGEGRRVVGGTPGFMAPELYRGERGDAAVDLFALGVTGYLLLTGRFPYGQPEATVTPSFAPFEPIVRLRPEVPSGLAAAVERCLSVARDRRPGDAGEFLAWLDDPDLLRGPRTVPLIQRNPLRFYQVGFWLFLATTLALALRLAMV